MRIDSLYRKPNGNLGAIVAQAPIDSLVFEGGGPKGLVYVGALEVLEERGMLAAASNVGGSSAGAITALAVGLGLDASRCRELALGKDTAEFMDPRPAGSGDPPVLGALADVGSALRNLLVPEEDKGRGVFLGDAFQAWVRGVVAARLDEAAALEDAEGRRAFAARVRARGTATFGELAELARRFPELGIKRVAFTGTNYTDQTLDVFSAETTPDMPVDLAVRISSSLPWFFQSVVYDGKEYMDGGCLDNFPMGIFDRAPYVPAGHRAVVVGAYGQNLCTLGFRVDSQEEIRRILWESARKDDSGILAKLARGVKDRVIDLCVGAEYSEAVRATDAATYGKYAQRTVQIPDLGYGTLDFKLEEADKRKLAGAGEAATREWLSLYYDDAGVEIELASVDELRSYVEQGELDKLRARFPGVLD